MRVKKNATIQNQILTDSNSVSDSNSDSDSNSGFMNLHIFIFFILYLHSSK